jgi:hypothetical protein
MDGREANENDEGVWIGESANPVPFLVVPSVPETQAVGLAINSKCISNCDD